MSSDVSALARNILIQDQDSFEIHGPSSPEDVLRGEPIRAEVVYNGQKRSCRVWKISPLGIELIDSDFEKDIRPGDLIDVTVSLGIQNIHYNGLFVKFVRNQQQGTVVGIRLVEEKGAVDGLPVEDRRKEKRWLCDQEYLPTGMSPNPVRFGDYVYFKVRNISATGLQLSTSLRNKFVLKGMVLDAMLTFPMVGQVSCRIKVTNVRVVSEGSMEVLYLGVTVLEEFYGRFKEVAAQYLLQFGDIKTLQELKESNFKSARMGKSLDLRYVRTQKDYEDVLELRRKAYIAEGKASPDAKLYDMATEYDSTARICMVVYGGKVVASAAIIFHTAQTKIEQERFFEWISDYPDREDLIEVNRVCTDPEFRGADTLYALFRFIAIVSIQSGRNYCIICTTEKLAPLYNKLGFKNSGKYYDHPDLGNQKHYMFIGNIVKGITGEGVNPIAWNLVYSDVTDFLNQYIGYKFSLGQMLRMLFLRSLKPFIKGCIRKKK